LEDAYRVLVGRFEGKRQFRRRKKGFDGEILWERGNLEDAKRGLMGKFEGKR
jgi:hypothetical protein